MKEELKSAWKAIDDKFGTDIVILDISKITPIADYFVITSGQNLNQMKSIADNVETELFKRGLKALHLEGYGSSWILMDFGNIVVHIFDKQDREFYDLERLWADALKVNVEM